jgi:tight adherence protein B
MDAIFNARVGMAAVAFIAMALAVVAVAFGWEGIRSLLKRRTVGRELRRLAERQVQGGQSPTGNLLKEDRGELPPWLAPVVRLVPRLSDIAMLLEQARSSWSIGTFLILTLGLALAGGTVGALLGLGLLVALVGAATGAVIPYLILVRKRSKRLTAFEEGFPEAIDLLSRSVRAGHAFQTGLREVADEMKDPIGEEFRQVFEEQKFGLPLPESLMGLADRIDIVDVRMFITSVLVQKETGGNLAENMDTLAHVIRERFRFKRQIKVHTAHGRMTGAVLAVVPLVMLLLLYMISPEYMGAMFTETAGRWMLAAAGVFQIFGFLVIRRMTNIEY